MHAFWLVVTYDLFESFQHLSFQAGKINKAFSCIINNLVKMVYRFNTSLFIVQNKFYIWVITRSSTLDAIDKFLTNTIDTILGWSLLLSLVS